MTSTSQQPSSPMRGKGRVWLYGLLAVLVGLVVIGLLQRAWHHAALEREAADEAITRVVLIKPQPGPATREVDLPANLAAWYEAPIYAQVSGYVKMWYKDYGAHVKRGDLLAEVSTPSIDAQYAAAKAHYEVINARYKLALITTQRWTALRSTQAVSRQEVDVQAANAAAQRAELDAAAHEVERVEALENFKRIVAPFDGIVTSRLVNVGDYVNATGGNMSARGAMAELFSVADVHKIRVFVSVPQDFASVISPKISADLSVPQYPGRSFKARFLATANAFNAATRTVTTELVLDNPDGLLWPNSYATAHIHAPGDTNILIVPTNALIFRAQGMQVAKVVHNHITLLNVQAGTNYGMTTQILSGLSAEDEIVANPTADMLDGDEVKVVTPTRGYNDHKPKEALAVKNVTSNDLRRVGAMPPPDENNTDDADKTGGAVHDKPAVPSQQEQH
ncbi:efflux RND transporter periplasmic adaptor subunit [Bombella saccharophila]|uniref:Efflux RND transporter periplasmic adaptor subunit n=1 Tax=Bombella saccharophila TaxID=2967338 RepID=A0ABT3W7F5_9PROT|nr:efflux RND transporter periplasmic adaptor subunit [Bombella saccharophila]MCX5615035.1 efflux RND transporter periplasmic adaptor subunit [Bombella saccharophila]